MDPNPPPAETTFETERLRLEPLRQSHAAEMFDGLRDPRLYTYIPHDPPDSLDAVVGRFQRLERRASPDGTEQWLNWVLRTKDSGHCVGRVEATLRPDRPAYLAYEIAVAEWGRGYATEACARLVRILFDACDVTRIVAEVDTRNAASIALLERLGFERTGYKTGADFFKGASSDEFTYELAAR